MQFCDAGKIYTFVTTDPTLVARELVMVETQGGPAIGRLTSPPKEIADNESPQGTKRILHRASPEEIKKFAKYREQALEYFLVCQEKVRERNLQMKLVDAQIEEDGKRIVFVFYAEQRVDFRTLVKDLAGILHMRIEMRQVGARDEAKHRGCLGPCGLHTCCSLHLRQFQPISISMAKHQGLAPNPAKLTGMCGKLKCCLSYEHDIYNEYRKDLPKIGSAVSSPLGPGKVSGHNILRKECTVRLFGGGECRCACSACSPLDAQAREAALSAARRAEEEGEERLLRRAKRLGGDRKDRNDRSGRKSRNNMDRTPRKK